MPVLADGGLTYNSNQAFTRSDSGLGFSLFTRRYLGNRCCFLFHRLVICLSSAGRSYTPQVGNTKKTSGRKNESYETTGSPRPKP